MAYQVFIEKKAKKQLKEIPEPAFSRIVEAIENLAFEPKPFGSKKLVGRNGYRIRVGTYRIIYAIEVKVLYVLVLEVGPRGDIYKK